MLRLLMPVHGGAISSVGRASRLHRGGRQFESVIAHHLYVVINYIGGVAQLVRVPACHAEGREFESRHPRHLYLVTILCYISFTKDLYLVSKIEAI